MIRWLRVVLPPGWTLALLGVLYVGGQLFFRLIEWLTKSHLFALGDAITIPFVTFTAVLYAVHRVCTFHPALRPGYCDWLRGTPWTSRMPFPLGPVHLVWQDLLILGAAGALAALVAHLIGAPPDAPRNPQGSEYVALGLAALRPLQAFLIVYFLTLAVVNYLTGEKLLSFAVVFAVGWMCLVWSDALAFFPLALACYEITLLALRRSLARFPWEESTTIKELHRMVRIGILSQKNLLRKPTGWPYDQLGPEFNDLPARVVAFGVTNWLDTLLMGVLAGWWLFIMHTGLGRADRSAMPNDNFGLYFAYYFWLTFFALGRLCIYMDAYLPPLSIAGRVAHLRLIIPGYDQIFVAPLSAIAVGVAAWYLPALTGARPIFIVAPALTLSWWILFGVGPGLTAWRLTGHHRLTRNLFVQKDLVRTA